MAPTAHQELSKPDSATVVPVASHRRGLLLSERRLVLAGLDTIAVGVAWIAAFNLRTAEVKGVGFYVPRLGTIIVIALWLLCAWLAGAYELRGSPSLRSFLRQVLTALGLTTIGLLLVFFIDPYRITRPTVLIWIPLAAPLTLGMRVAFRRLATTRTLAARIVLLAPEETVQRIWPQLELNLSNSYVVVGRIDPAGEDVDDRLLAMVDAAEFDEVIVGVRDDVPRPLFAALLRVSERGATVRSLADLYEELTGRLLLDELGHSWLMSLPMKSRTSRLYAGSKRLLDIVVAGLGLLVMLCLLPFLALAIRLETKGPVLYRQPRLGQYGRPFALRKLRTMRVTDSTDWTAEKDVRITRVGKFLRRTHLDELPQLLSVLRGEMSLIGPRPEQPRYVAQLSREIDFYNTRHTVRPGITGWAQLHYGYGSGVEGARVKLSYDLYYIKRQSISLDAAIIVRTFFLLVTFSGR